MVGSDDAVCGGADSDIAIPSLVVFVHSSGERGDGRPLWFGVKSLVTLYCVLFLLPVPGYLTALPTILLPSVRAGSTNEKVMARM